MLKEKPEKHSQAAFFRKEHKNVRINLIIAYMSCPLDIAAGHTGFFTTDTPNAQVIKKFFGSMKLDVRAVKQLSELAKTL